MSVLASYDSILESMRAYGEWRRAIHIYSNDGITALTSTAGGASQYKRFNTGVTVPSMAAGVLGMYLIQAKISGMTTQSAMAEVIALEYELGSLNMSTGAFTDGVVMPTKRYSGKAAVQSASQLTLLVSTANITATTPSIVVTYKNQSGTGGQTATMTLPTNAVSGSGYSLHTVLAANDTGMQDVTNMTKSAGSAGTLKCYGYLILAAAAYNDSSLEPMRVNYPNWLCETGERITFLEQSGRNISTFYATMLGVAET